VIKRKMKGQTITLGEERRPMRAEVVDLAERLKASLEAAGGRGARSGGRQAAKTRKTAPAKKRRKPAA
jgi:non-homologous end joining protein Ku